MAPGPAPRAPALPESAGSGASPSKRATDTVPAPGSNRPAIRHQRSSGSGSTQTARSTSPPEATSKQGRRSASSTSAQPSGPFQLDTSARRPPDRVPGASQIQVETVSGMPSPSEPASATSAYVPVRTACGRAGATRSSETAAGTRPGSRTTSAPTSAAAETITFTRSPGRAESRSA